MSNQSSVPSFLDNITCAAQNAWQQLFPNDEVQSSKQRTRWAVSAKIPNSHPKWASRTSVPINNRITQNSHNFKALISAPVFASVTAALPSQLSSHPTTSPPPQPFAHTLHPHHSSRASSSTATPTAAAKAEVGRATWTLLHTLAAQLPDRPSRRQQRDVRALIDLLTRIYPCGDCASHFAEMVRRDPPVVSSGPAFRRWLCGVHNRVNARLGKPTFNCDLVDSRWAPLACGAAGGLEGAESEGGGGAGGGAGSGCELLGVGGRAEGSKRGVGRRW